MDTTIKLPVASPARARAARPLRSRPRRPARAVPRDELTAGARRRRVEVMLWALRHGRPVFADALTFVLLAKQSQGEPIDRWTSADVSRLLWVEVVELADRVGVEVPAGVAETLWTLLDTYADHALFARGSEPIAALREPLRQLGGLDRNGRARPRLRHPSAQPARSG